MDDETEAPAVELVAPAPAPGQPWPAPARRTSPVALVSVALGVVGLAVVGVLLVRGWSGSSGGFDSPESAVHALAAAVSHEDPAGVVAALAPEEVRTLGRLYDTAEATASAAGLTAPDAAAGIDAEVTDLDLEIHELGDGVAEVRFRSGAVRLEVDPSAFTPTMQAALPDDVEASTTTIDVDAVEDALQEAIGEDPFLVAVERDGGWYVSPVLTLAEYVTRALDLPTGDFDEDATEPARDRGDDPGELLADLATAAGDLDVDDLAGTVAGDEIPLAAYEDAIDEVVQEAGVTLDMDVDDVRVHGEELGGGNVKIVVESASGEVTVADADGAAATHEWRIRGTCFEVDDDESCLDDQFEEVTGIAEPFVVATREDGRLVVSPIGTVLAYAQVVLEHVDTDVVLAVLGVPQAAPPTADLAVGEPTTADLNRAGFATFSLDATAGSQLSVGATTGDEYVQASLYTPDGDEVERLYPYCSTCVYRVPADGRYRVVVDGGSPFAADGAVDVLVAAVEPVAVTIPGALSKADVGDTEVAVFEMAATAGDLLSIALDGDPTATLVDASGDPAYCGSSDGGYVCQIEATGVHTLLVEGPAGDVSGRVEVLPPVGFDNGGTHVDGYVSGGSVYYDLRVHAGYVSLTVTPDPGFDVVVEVVTPDGQPIYRDSGYSGDQEVLSFSTGGGTCVVELSGYAGDTGSFSMTASFG